MKKFLLIIPLAALISGCSLSGLPSNISNFITTPGPTGGSGEIGAAPPIGSCHAADGGNLPDSKCTPGDTDSRVTQADIASTICTRGYTSTVRPSVTVTEPFKREVMSSYGLNEPLSMVELDHLIPLELGGASTAANLWPEPRNGSNGAYAKDQLENKLNALVCDGQLTLDVAQKAISTNWETAYSQYAG